MASKSHGERIILKKIIFIIIYLKLAAFVFASSEQSEYCPRMCICSFYNGLNAANCSDDHLISANIGMSSYVELLDLSNNDIYTIDSQCFSNLVHLNTLLLNRNSISYIELDAFSGLTNLQHINLANNRLESFDNRIFEQNIHLIDINLAGNKFMNIPNEPFIRSQSLQTLDLHTSQLSHLHVNIFVEVPNIKSIDLSENLLIVFNLAAFATNSRLRFLNIEDNPIACDAQMEMSLVWMKRNRVRVIMENCPPSKPKIPHKFERIQMIPSVQQQRLPSSIATQAPNDLKNIWHTSNHNIPLLNEQCTYNDSHRACDLFAMCVANMTILLKEVDEKLMRKNEVKMNYSLINLHHRNWSNFVTVNVAFFGGLFLGAMCGAIVLFLIKVIVSECFSKKKRDAHREMRRQRNRQIYSSEIRSIDEERPLNNNVTEAVVASQQSRQNRSRPSGDSREIVRQHHQPSRSFFAIFYERPVRRRYYRQLNRSATNLVRRLSQSRLFLNLSRAQRNSYIRANSRTTRVPETIEISPNHDGYVHPIRLDAVSLSETMPMPQSTSLLSLNLETEHNRNEHVELDERRHYASDSDLSTRIERVETPPPPYTYVVVTRK